MKHLKKDIKGFTIIEVMIVLAIAGLIMVVVLIAAPQLQRNQRNSARKDITNRIKTELDNYSSNNAGQIPTTSALLTTFQTRYLSAATVNLKDPKTGNSPTLTYSATPDGVVAPPSYGTYYYHDAATCGGTEVANTSSSARNYALWTTLEGGAGYCVDNQ